MRAASHMLFVGSRSCACERRGRGEKLIRSCWGGGLSITCSVDFYSWGCLGVLRGGGDCGGELEGLGRWECVGCWILRGMGVGCATCGVQLVAVHKGFPR